MNKSTHTRRQNARPTIGLAIDRLAESYQSHVWLGIADVAQEQDVNLILFAGRALRAPHGFDYQSNVIYDLASPETLDGLIVMSGAVSSFVGLEGLRHFCERYRPLPVVSVALAMEGIPCVLVDNERPMYEAVTHLIQVHGRRRIAFIRGPEGHQEAERRYRAYLNALADCGLPFDPALVAPGDFVWSTGMEAIRLLMDEREVDFQAVVAANDSMALGVLETLQARGIRVPEDVAVVGFDDVEIARFATPPLTTVRQPLHELGRKAAEMVLALLAGEPVPEQVVLPTSLVVRGSCGCLSPAVLQAAAGAATAKTLEATFAARRLPILSEIAQRVDAGSASQESVSGWAEQLLDAFTADLKDRSAPGVFLPTLDTALRVVTVKGGDVLSWQAAISTLHRYMLPCLKDSQAVRQAESLCHQARVMIGEIAQQAVAYRKLQVEWQAERANETSQELITTFDVPELMNAVARRLPQLGIESAYVSLYDQGDGQANRAPSDWSRLILACNRTGRVELEPGGRRFLSRRLTPDDLMPVDRRWMFLVEGLYFREDQLGFAVFEIGPRQGAVYEVLRGQLSSALQGALLVQRVQERSAELARQQYVFDTFMENVPDYIYIKDLDSRITRANKAHAIMLGLSDLAEEIGKSDFDFFPEEQARAKYEQEQAIIRTGQPILNLEEPNGMERWVLTTKMPLRDENGNIVGTFGISRDITGFKRTEVALERRAAQLALLNEVGRKIATILDLESVLNTAAHLVQESFGYHHVGLFTVDRERGELVMRARAGQFAHLFPSDHRIKLGQGLVGWVGDYGARLLADDVSVESRYTNFYPDLIPTRSELGVPIRVGEETVGVLDVQSPQLNAFDQNDVLMMEILADQIAVAIENARLYEAVQRELAERKRAEEAYRRQTEYLSALHDTTLGLVSRLNITDLLEAIIARAAALVGTEHGFVHLLEPGESEMEMRIGIGTYADLVGSRTQPGVGLSGSVWGTGQPLVVDDYRTWPGRLTDPRRDLMHAVVGVPLKSGEAAIGVIGLAYLEAGRLFGPAELDALNRFAALASVALDNATLFRQTQDALSWQQALYRASEMIGKATTIEGIVRGAAELMPPLEMSSCSATLITEIDPEGYPIRGSLYTVRFKNNEFTILPNAIGKSILGWLPSDPMYYSEFRITVFPDLEDLSTIVPQNFLKPVASIAFMLRQGFRGAVTLGLGAHGRKLGYLIFCSSSPLTRPPEEYIERLKNVIDLVSTAVDNLQLLQQTQRELAERKRAEEQLQRYSAELVQSNEELKRFTYIVSHDLRAPLVNLRGFAAELDFSLEVIRSAFESLLPHLDEKQRPVVATALVQDLPEALGFIEASVTRMDHLINALLTLSRLGRRELDLERINMQALIQATLETLAHQIEQRQVRVTVGSLPELVADRTSLEQVVGNILNNAIIYLEPGRAGEIEISGERNEDETIFRIRDNGRGIVQEDMDKVFAPFRRAGKQDIPGEGMGLAYVQTLVRRHGGRIGCESEPGAGTTFTFTVPHQLTQGDQHA